MKYIIRLRFANELGEGFTDIGTDMGTAEALIEAGCDNWKTAGPYERQPSVTYIETYNLAYVQELGRQRDEARLANVQALATALENTVKKEN